MQSLITSSQDDYEMASDGSRQVKIFLHCPQCRSDLRTSIRDTLLLRRADEAQQTLLEQQRQSSEQQSSLHPQSSEHQSNNHSNPRRLFRIKAALADDLVHEALVDAAAREADFFGWHTDSSSSSSSSSSSDNDDDPPSFRHKDASSFSECDTAWGVEADLLRGVHSSFYIPASQSVRKTALQQRILTIDKTLLGGLAEHLSAQQQEQVTEYFTSGDPAQLVQGAEILRKAARMATVDSGSGLNESFRGSVYALIAQANQARQKAQKRRRSSSKQASHSPTRRKRLYRAVQQQANYLQTHPLPVRLPKSIQINLPDPWARGNGGYTGLQFCDDVWDGTLRDAFCKITVTAVHSCRSTCPYRVGHQAAHGSITHKGVNRILDSDGPVRIDVQHPRVVVAAVLEQGGIMKGDVVTHVNGQVWEGSAAELQERLNELYRDDEATSIHLALNCSVAVAQVLKQRSLVE